MSELDGKFKEYYWWPLVDFIFGSDDGGKTIWYCNNNIPQRVQRLSDMRLVQIYDIIDSVDKVNNDINYIKEALKWLSNI